MVVLFLGTASVWAGSCGFHGCPSAAELRSFAPSEGSRILDRSGRPLGRLSYVRRVNVPLDSIPEVVRQAFIATEDRRFYRHDGIDWWSVPRAALENLLHLEIRQGFSTITMQVVRNAFIPELARERSLRRKLLEMGMARRLEEALTKDEILELYLNVIYLGNGTFGVEAASRDLFGKSVSELSLAEAATLAALPKGPSYYAPRSHPDRAVRRRDLVLGLMAREGYITEARADDARERPLTLAKHEWIPPRDTSSALDPVRVFVDSVLGDRLAAAGDVVVHTTLDARAQRAAQTAVRRQAASIQRTAKPWNDGEPIEGAMVALDPRTGEIRALVGGRAYTRRGFNRALMARRQPGSAFKPFVYGTALSAGLTPVTLVDDVPVAVDQGNGTVWRPANYGDEYSGEITLRRALMLSANAATVRLSQAVGIGRVVEFAHRMGITSPIPAVPAVALGAVDVTPLELVAAYAPFANGGYRVTPTLVTRIEAADGTVLWEAHPTRERVLSKADAYQITSMLRSVVDHGTGYVVRELGVRGPVAGKTGTTNEGNDVWFVGYTPTIVAGFWFGYDTPHMIAPNASGGRFAAPAWVSFYRNGWRERAPDDAWAPPPGMVPALVDPTTGYLAGEWCPEAEQEWFKPGTEPVRYCPEHDAPFFHWLGRKVKGALEAIF